MKKIVNILILTSFFIFLGFLFPNNSYASQPDSCFDFDPRDGTINGYDITCGANVGIPSELFGYYTYTVTVSVGTGGEQKEEERVGSGRSTVLKIGTGAFKGKEIIGVFLPDTVTTIGESAFEGCSKLQGVIISPDNSNLRTIGKYAFSGTSLEFLTLPNKLNYIGQYAFYSAFSHNLEQITLPVNYTQIENYAFAGNYLRSVLAKAPISLIGNKAFALNPNGLTGAEFKVNLVCDKGVITTPSPIVANDANVTIDDSCTSLSNAIGGECFIVSNNTIVGYDEICGGQNLVIKGKIGDTIIYKIGSDAFRNKNLLSVTIDEGIEEIGDFAFAGNTNLSKIELPKSLKKIGTNAFYNGSILNVEIPDNVTEIGQGAFYSNRIRSLKLGKNIETIEYSAFAGNYINEVKIPEELKLVKSNAFSNNPNGLNGAVSPVKLYCENYFAIPNVESFANALLDESCLTGSGYNSASDSGGGSSGGNGNSTYGKLNVNIYQTVGGRVEASKTYNINAGEKITLRVIPYTGYYFYNFGSTIDDNISLVDIQSDNIFIYEFKMGTSDVSFRPVFLNTTNASSTISIDKEMINGKVHLTQTRANMGDRVYFKVEPSYGYEVGQIRGLEGLNPKMTENGVYSFIMPSYNVTVGATFVSKQDNYTSNYCFAYNGHTIISYNVGCGDVVNIPSNIQGTEITEIGDGAFQNANLTKVTIGKGITKIGRYAFANNYLSGVSIPSTLTYVGDGAFLSNYTDGSTSVKLTCDGFKLSQSVSFASNTNAVLDSSCKGDYNGNTVLSVCTQTDYYCASDNKVRLKYNCLDYNNVVGSSCYYIRNLDLGANGSSQVITSLFGETDDMCIYSGNSAFTDIDNSFAKCYIQSLYSDGVVKGYSDNTYKPESNIYRGEFLALIMRGFRIDLDAYGIKNNFTDLIGSNTWLIKYVNKAIEMKMLDQNNTKFRPFEAITRMEAMKLLLIIANLETPEVVNSTYSDVEGWAAKYVELAKELGIVNSDNSNFRPNDPITRAEVAKVLYKVLKLRK